MINKRFTSQTISGNAEVGTVQGVGIFAEVGQSRAPGSMKMERNRISGMLHIEISKRRHVSYFRVTEGDLRAALDAIGTSVAMEES